MRLFLFYTVSNSQGRFCCYELSLDPRINKHNLDSLCYVKRKTIPNSASESLLKLCFFPQINTKYFSVSESIFMSATLTSIIHIAQKKYVHRGLTYLAWQSQIVQQYTITRTGLKASSLKPKGSLSQLLTTRLPCLLKISLSCAERSETYMAVYFVTRQEILLTICIWPSVLVKY